MHTKLKPGGDVDHYRSSEKDHRGEDRDQDPVDLGGALKMMTEAICNRAPASITDADKRRRRIRHLWRYLVHLIVCFSERQAEVEYVLPRVIRAKQDLILAGCPRDCLSFSWTEHPQNIGAHAHGGLGLVLLPRGGPYDLNLPARLNLLHDRLVSNRLGLSDPLSRFPLVMACDFSYRKEREDLVKKVIDETQNLHATKLAQGGGITHRDFLNLLQPPSFGFKILYAPDNHGKPGPKQTPPPGVELKLYNHVVATLSPEGWLTYWKGPVCRSDFDHDKYDEKCKSRSTQVTDLKKKKKRHEVFLEFRELLKERIATQKRLTATIKHGAERIRFEDFLWLDEEPVLMPAGLIPSCPVTYELDPDFGAEDPLRYGPESTYPFFTGWALPRNSMRLVPSPGEREPETVVEPIPLMGGKWIDRRVLTRKRRKVILEIGLEAARLAEQELSRSLQPDVVKTPPASPPPTSPATASTRLVAVPPKTIPTTQSAARPRGRIALPQPGQHGGVLSDLGSKVLEGFWHQISNTVSDFSSVLSKIVADPVSASELIAIRAPTSKEQSQATRARVYRNILEPFSKSLAGLAQNTSSSREGLKRVYGLYGITIKDQTCVQTKAASEGLPQGTSLGSSGDPLDTHNSNQTDPKDAQERYNPATDLSKSLERFRKARNLGEAGLNSVIDSLRTHPLEQWPQDSANQRLKLLTDGFYHLIGFLNNCATSRREANETLNHRLGVPVKSSTTFLVPRQAKSHPKLQDQNALADALQQFAEVVKQLENEFSAMIDVVSVAYRQNPIPDLK